MSRQPTFGTTRSGQPVHAKTRDNLTEVLKFSPKAIRQAVGEVEGFNAKLAVIITSGVGTMACAYVFAVIALISLPEAIRGGTAPLIQWIAQTFLQLVLLSIIMVGQRVQSVASDARAGKAFEYTEVIMDRLDTSTQGGISEVLAAVQRLGAQLGPASAGPAVPGPAEIASDPPSAPHA